MERGESCEFVCKEFKFGTPGNLFIGRLSFYWDFFKKLEALLDKH